MEVRYGWFDNVPALKEFLSAFNQIMQENSKIPDVNPENYFVKVKPIDADPIYYSEHDTKGFTVIDYNTVKRLNNLINEAPIVPSNQNSEHFEGIKLDVIYHPLSVWAHLYITPEGDIDLHMWTMNKHPIDVKMRTSPKLFKQLEEIIVYSKHSKPVPELDEDGRDIYFSRVFQLNYNLNGKSKLVNAIIYV